MREDLEPDLLTLLEESSNKGCLVIMLHIFSDKMKIGNVVLSENCILQSSNVGLDLCSTLQSYVNSRLTEFVGLRVFEFSVVYGETAVGVVGEVLETPLRLLIFGAGHIGQAVAMIGALAGYNVIVVDDRAEFLTAERFPSAAIKLVEGRYNSIKSHVEITKNTAVVIVTRGHQYDEVCLQQVLGGQARYVGMIGSRRRVLSIFNRLEASGVSKHDLESVYAPIGLKIGAASPQEIAVAILAEIIAVMSGYTLDDIPGRGR